MDDHRPVEEPFGPDAPNFTDAEPDTDDALQDKPTEAWEEENTDDPTEDEVSDEELTDLGEGGAPATDES